jgi:hypothetical protein
MASDESDLWPSDLAVDVVPPLTILNEQAEALSKKTGGIVKAEIVHVAVAGAFTQYGLDLWAPAIGFRHRLLLVRYDHTMPYPVVLIAASLLQPMDYHDPNEPDQETWKLNEIETKQARLAYTPKNVRDLLKSIFNSPSTRAALFSMVARSNEVKSLLNGSKQSVEPIPDPGTESGKLKGKETPNP